MINQEKIEKLKHLEEKLKNSKKNPEIALPSFIFLTPAGLGFFRNNAHQVLLIKRYQNMNGFSKEGFFTNSFNAQVMQKLIMKFYIEEIYTLLPELLPLRQEIISTNNLIIYAILYRKLTPSLAKALFESKVVKEFNRKNPKYSMTELNHISIQKVDQLFQQYGSLLENIKVSIREKVTEKILSNTYLEEEDMFARVRSLPKFIEWIDKRVWFLFFIIYQKEDLREQMVHTFENMIYNYLEHTVIATHLSNLIMEFIQNAEKAHFELLAKKHLGISKDQLDAFIRSRENRLKLKKLAIDTKQMLQISWNLNPEKLASTNLSRIQIQISNYGIIDEDTAQRLRKKMKADVDGISIASFYDDQDENKLGAGLGLLYNSYLEQACKKEGIQYRCAFYPEPKQQKTTVKIDMTL
jgi:hypothetical protein